MMKFGEATAEDAGFCMRPWRPMVTGLAILVFGTFFWAFYLLSHYWEDDYFAGVDDLDVGSFLLRNVAAGQPAGLLDTIQPAVVGIGRGKAGTDAGVVASGAIVSGTGYVLTTLHSVMGAQEINVQVNTPTGIRNYPAQIVKSEPTHDLALLKMRTTDRFLHFSLADPNAPAVPTTVFAAGFGPRGVPILRQGQMGAGRRTVDTGGGAVSHLLINDAAYTWEQAGGPVVNTAGELVGVTVLLNNPKGGVEGYAVPASVIASHFQDLVKFRRMKANPPAPPVPVPAPSTGTPAPTLAPSSTLPSSPSVTIPGEGQWATAAAAWWAKARAEVADKPPQSLGMNVAAPVLPVPAPVLAPAPAISPSMPAPIPGTTSPTVLGGPGVLPTLPQVFPAVDPDHTGGVTIGGFPVVDIVGLAVLALVAGIVGGMMTMGGGVLQVAGMMIFFGYGMYLIRPVACITNVFVYGAAALRNDRAGLVMWDNVRALAPWGVGGVVVGYFIGNAIDDKVVAFVLGTFALLMALKGLHEIFTSHRSEEILIDESRLGKKTPRWEAGDAEMAGPDGQDRVEKRVHAPGKNHARNALLGLPMGLVNGILGISGGVVEVPLQRYYGGVSLRNAIANSSVLVFWASVGGTAVAYAHGISIGILDWNAPLSLALIMVPGAYVGGLLGARLMKVLPTVVLRWIYTAIMLATAIKLLSVSS
ncbi:MAG: TSUP family transporter [Alphaproteobacteria bacterium]